MRKSRFSESQIISIIRQHQAGTKIEDLCRRPGLIGTTHYKWKAKREPHGAMLANHV